MTLQRPPHQDCSWMITELHSNSSLPLVIEVNGESFFSGRWEEFSLKNASFQFRAPPSYQLNLMRRCTATFLQKGNWTVYKNALTESSHWRHREWKGSRIYVYTHTHTLIKEFSGQNNQARDKVVFWQFSAHQTCTPWFSQQQLGCQAGFIQTLLNFPSEHSVQFYKHTLQESIVANVWGKRGGH